MILAIFRPQLSTPIARVELASFVGNGHLSLRLTGGEVSGVSKVGHEIGFTMQTPPDLHLIPLASMTTTSNQRSNSFAW